MTDDDLRSQMVRTDERATKALESIARHEASCDRRYADLNDTMRVVFNRIELLQGRWFWTAAALIAGLFALTGYLLINGRPWG